LVLPLVLLSAASLVVHVWWPAAGFFVNLATELLGIVITVAYVDWILRRNEAERWRGTDTRIQERLKIFSNALISGIRAGLEFRPDVLSETVMLSGNPDLMHKEILRVAEHVLEPSARTRLDRLDQAGWKQLATHIQSTWVEAERLIDRFGSRLGPRQMELMLDIQQALARSLTFWGTFPDLAGVPDEELPRTKTPPELLKASGYDSTAAELRNLLKCARSLTAGDDIPG
jgi:hypothetical protein